MQRGPATQCARAALVAYWLAWWLALASGLAGAEVQDPAAAMQPLRGPGILLHDLDSGEATTVDSLPARRMLEPRRLRRFRLEADFHVADPAAAPLWALYFSWLREGGRVSVNGVTLGEWPTASRDTAVLNIEPRIVTVAPHWLRAGRNRLQLQWSTIDSLQNLPAVHFGPADAVRPAYERHRFWQNAMAQVSFDFALVCAVLLFGIHAVQRGERRYLLMGLTSLGWAAVCIGFFLPPMPEWAYPWWRLARVAGIGLATASIWVFMTLEVQPHNRWFPRLALGWCALGPLGYLYNFVHHDALFTPGFEGPWAMVLMLLGVVPLAALAVGMATRWHWRLGVFFAATLAVLVTGVADIVLLSTGASVFGGHAFAAQAISPIWFTAVVVVLVLDFARFLAGQRQQHAVLARRLVEQQAVLKRLHDDDQRHERERAALRERQRVMLDMHDGLGSQLVGALAQAERGALDAPGAATLLRECIDDLRLAIDSLADGDDAFAVAAGNLRFRMQPRLRAAGIALRWDVRGLDDAPPLPAAKLLPLLRILQEAIVNALRHAQASEIAVTIDLHGGALRIGVRDDGRGFDPARAAPARGLAAMDKRAAAIGATLRVRARPPGCRVELALPLAGGAPMPAAAVGGGWAVLRGAARGMLPWAACLLGMAWSPPAPAAHAADAPPVVRIDSAMVHSLDGAPPIRLDDLPQRRLLHPRGFRRFRVEAQFELADPAAAPLWALYFRQMSDGGHVSVNGVPVGQLPTSTADTAVLQVRPAMFTLPPQLLRPGANTLQVDLATHDSSLHVAAILVGPQARLRANYERQHFWQITMAQVGLDFALLNAAILIGIFALRRHEWRYLLMGLTALGWANVCFAYLLPPMPAWLYPYWHFVRLLGIGGVAGLCGMVLWLETEPRHAGFGWLCLAWAAVGPLIYLADFWWRGSTDSTLTKAWWGLPLLGLAVYPMTRLARRLARAWDWRRGVYLLAALAGVLAGGADLVLSSTGRELFGPVGYSAQATSPLWFTAMVAVLVKDFGDFLLDQRRQNEHMASRLAEQQAVLTQLHAVDQQRERERATLQERQRIMQDMHDGLGSQLVSALALAERGALDARQTTELLRECIDDLRLAIDSLAVSGDAFAVAAGNLRHRMQPRLQAAGIALDWDHVGLDEPQAVPPSKSLPLLRILQEALSNALRHSGATAIRVQLAFGEQGLSIRVDDNGRGFDPQRVRWGKGVRSMEKRCRAIGAQLRVQGDQGTRVSVRLPMPG
jgi:signal transduction histidine kinase